MDKKDKFKAGHYEIQGETIAKFEFFDNGYNPYSRYLDVDKIDLILRKRDGNDVKYIEVQVKYCTLYECKPKWQRDKFDCTSWKFFKVNEFQNSPNTLFVAFILSDPKKGYKGDIFIFPVKVFHKLINSAILCNTKKGIQAKIYIAHSTCDDKWYLWKKWGFEKIDDTTTIDVTKYRRNFKFQM